MKVSKFSRAVCAVGIASVCLCALVACAAPAEESSSGTEITGLTGGVAATVNGTEIQEDTVTTWIESYRITNGLTDQNAWGQWLADGGYAPESIREEIINYYMGQDLIRQAAEENGIAIESSEIDEYVEHMKVNYSTEDKWQEALKNSGKTENGYRSEIEIALLERKVKEKVTVAEEPTTEELLEQAKTYATTYNGAKRSSHILFDSGDEAKAQEVLGKINSGEIDFVEAANEYSKDTASAVEGGDVGWDKLTSFVSQYTDALAGLEKDQVSALVTSDYGIHVIKCTDVFTAPEEVTDINQLPTEFIDSIKTSLESTKKDEAFSTWYNNYKETADVVINAMPETLPYLVDMSQFTPAEGSTGAIAAAAVETDTTAPEDTTGNASASSDAAATVSENTAVEEGDLSN